MYGERRRFACGKVYTYTMVINWREIIPTEGFRAEIEKPVATHTFLWMRRGAKHIRCGFTLRQYSTCSTSYFKFHVQPAENRQPGYRWEDS